MTSDASGDDSADELIRDAAGNVVAVGHTAEHTEDEYRTEQRFAEMARLSVRAEQCASMLVGLTVDAARAKVDEWPELSIQFATDAVSAEFCFGRITAWVAGGVVRRAGAG